MAIQKRVCRRGCLFPSPFVHRRKESVDSLNLVVSGRITNKVIGHHGSYPRQYTPRRHSIVEKILDYLRQQSDDNELEKRKSARKSGGGSKSRENDSEHLQRRGTADNSSNNSISSVSNDSFTSTLDFEVQETSVLAMDSQLSVSSNSLC